MELGSQDRALRGVPAVSVPLAGTARSAHSTFLFALSGHLIATGLKAMVTGGGYGKKIGLVPDLLGIGETSFLSMLSAVAIPLILFLKRHSLISRRAALRRWPHNMIAAVAVLTSLGTFARTGLIALGVLGSLLWFQSKRKVLVGFGLLMSGAIGALVMSQTWLDRMSTISNPNADSSAGQRLDIWKWTWSYVAAIPSAAGSTLTSSVRSCAARLTAASHTVNGRAFHSLYFEILGEHGYVGFGIFALIILSMFVTMVRIRRKTRGIVGLEWLHDLMKALMMAFLIYLASAFFIGIGFQPPLYYLIAIVISGGQYYVRATQRSPTRSWQPPARRYPLARRVMANAPSPAGFTRKT